VQEASVKKEAEEKHYDCSRTLRSTLFRIFNSKNREVVFEFPSLYYSPTDRMSFLLHIFSGCVAESYLSEKGHAHTVAEFIIEDTEKEAKELVYVLRSKSIQARSRPATATFLQPSSDDWEPSGATTRHSTVW
jgi:hypothetical protein